MGKQTLNQKLIDRKKWFQTRKGLFLMSMFVIKRTWKVFLLLLLIVGLYGNLFLKTAIQTVKQYPYSNQHPPSRNELYFKKGEFLKLNILPQQRDLNIAKTDGTFDDKSNDLMELCKDWLYYREKIFEYTGSGDNASATEARDSFNKINMWLSAYDENDTQHMFTLIEESGYKTP